MAYYRTLSISFWTDSKVVDDFTPEDKYFYLYLMTNPHTNLCGCYELSTKQASNETGYNTDTIERLLRRFEVVHDVIRYSRATKEVLILNWHKYNWTKSEKFRKPLICEIGRVKEQIFREYLTSAFESDDTVSIPYPYGIDTSVTVTDTVSVTDTNSNNIDKPKGNRKPTADAFKDVISQARLSEPVKRKLVEFIEYRQEIKKPYKTERGVKSLVQEVEKQEQIHGSSAVIECIDTSMRNEWQGIFWEKIPKKREVTGEEAYFQAAMEAINGVS